MIVDRSAESLCGDDQTSCSTAIATHVQCLTGVMIGLLLDVLAVSMRLILACTCCRVYVLQSYVQLEKQRQRRSGKQHYKCTMHMYIL
jgi:hypothetical protein